jgi:hypothetical protein
VKKPKGFKAWLVTWEWLGNHAKPKEKVVEILDPRLHPERVREIVELLYHREALLSEKIAWRLRRRKQPYPAEFQILEGVKWRYDITCGHNPWLRARPVENLIIQTDADDKETASWTDRHHLPEVRKMLRLMSVR